MIDSGARSPLGQVLIWHTEAVPSLRWANRGQRVVILVTVALVLMALARFGIREGSSTEVIPQVTVTLPSSSPDSGGVSGRATFVTQPMGEGGQLLIVLGALVLWLVVAVVILKQPDRDSGPRRDES